MVPAHLILDYTYDRILIVLLFDAPESTMIPFSLVASLQLCSESGVNSQTMMRLRLFWASDLQPDRLASLFPRSTRALLCKNDHHNNHQFTIHWNCCLLHWHLLIFFFKSSDHYTSAWHPCLKKKFFSLTFIVWCNVLIQLDVVSFKMIPPPFPWPEGLLNDLVRIKLM